jgi:multiple RNA-binding domain-containing protein 1
VKGVKRIKTSHPQLEKGAPEAGPSRSAKGLKEFMSVMKGVDESLPVASSSKIEGTVPGEAGWVVDGMASKGNVKEGKAGAEIVKEVQREVIGEDDDDAAWLRRRQIVTLQSDEQDAGSAEVITNEVGCLRCGGSPLTLFKPIDPSTLILQTGRLFLRNLPFVTTSSDLHALLSPHGETTEIHLPLTPDSQPLGTAFIQFRDPSSALQAYKSLDRTIFLGRLLHVLPGRAKPGQEGLVAGEVMKDGVLGKIKEAKGEVKKGVDAKRREESVRGVNWATMYMNVRWFPKSIISLIVVC